jgi:hypothetical protein
VNAVSFCAAISSSTRCAFRGRDCHDYFAALVANDIGKLTSLNGKQATATVCAEIGVRHNQVFRIVWCSLGVQSQLLAAQNEHLRLPAAHLFFPNVTGRAQDESRRAHKCSAPAFPRAVAAGGGASTHCSRSRMFSWRVMRRKWPPMGGCRLRKIQMLSRSDLG